MSYMNCSCAMLVCALLPLLSSVDAMYALLAQLLFLAAWFDTAAQPK
jgi:hypothetical protein